MAKKDGWSKTIPKAIVRPQLKTVWEVVSRRSKTDLTRSLEFYSREGWEVFSVIPDGEEIMVIARKREMTF